MKNPALICILFFMGLLAGSSQTSSSKLSAHLIMAYTPGGSNIVAGHPRVLKILDLGSDMIRAARDYKATTPGGRIVLRIYTSKRYQLTEDAAASATNFWTTVLQPPLNNLSAADRALIDYLEGPNEGDSTPTWQSLQSAQWFSTFWQKLSPLIAAAGFKPCIGSIAVGNPPGTSSEVQASISAFVPALRQAKSLGGAWSYHAYTLNYTTDTGTEYWYALRYRQYYAQFASQYPDLLDLQLILTEGGVDQSGSPSGSGWQARGSAADYERWLNWFDRQLNLDSYVLGCTLFQIGNPAGWSSFDLEPIAGWFGNYLLPPASVPAAPTGLTGIPTNNTVLLRWTAPPEHPITYRVKRSPTSGGPYSLVAANITEGVTATTYTDASVSTGSTYHYVVTAVNARGESASSSQVTVTVPNTALPDVVVTAVSCVPSPTFVNNNVLFRATVKNQGAAPTPEGVIIGVGFSVDSGPNVTWAGGYTTSLAPGASVVLAANGGPTGSSVWKAVAGAHQLTATVDDINRFAESNESNNALTQKLSVSSGPPRIGSISAQGEQVTLSFSATAGLDYRTLYRTNLQQSGWQVLGPDITAGSTTMSVVDYLTNGPQRFYRVQQLD